MRKRNLRHFYTLTFTNILLFVGIFRKPAPPPQTMQDNVLSSIKRLIDWQTIKQALAILTNRQCLGLKILSLEVVGHQGFEPLYPLQSQPQIPHWSDRPIRERRLPLPVLNKINRGLIPYPHGPDNQPCSLPSRVSANANTSTGIRNI